MKEESPLDYHQSVPAKIQYEPSGEQVEQHREGVSKNMVNIEIFKKLLQ